MKQRHTGTQMAGRVFRTLILFCLLLALTLSAGTAAALADPLPASPLYQAETLANEPLKTLEKKKTTYRQVAEGTWIYKNSGTYFRNSKNRLVKHNWKRIEGQVYYFDSQGKMQTGWFDYENHRYYLNKDGHRQTGWLTLGKRKFHFSEHVGMLQKGFKKVDGQYYYFRETTGSMKTGFVKLNGKMYYFTPEGPMKTGWLTLNDKTYYFNANGAMQTEPCMIDGKGYVFNADGTLDPDAVYINPQGKMVALTFDDGPSNYTMTLLNALEKYHAKATFFMVGQSVPSYPNTIRKMVDLGCELGNHSYSHPSLTSLSSGQIASQVQRTNDQIRAITGRNATVMRPPYGNYNSTVLASVGLPAITWDVDPRDWATLNTYSTVSHVKQHVRDGSIVLIHDVYNASVQAAIQLIPWLQSQGYQLVTVSEMGKYRKGGLRSGVLYSRMYP